MPIKKLNPLLKMAILSGSQAAVRLHIKRGLEVNAIDERGCTPLILAASRGHAEICKNLLEAGADPYIQDMEGNDAIIIALEKKMDALAELLNRNLSESVINSDSGAIPTPQNAFIYEEAEQLDLYKEKIDLSTWEPEEDSPPPSQDDECLASVSKIHRIISAHILIDKDEDWSDVDIDLPSSNKNYKPAWNHEGRNEVLHLFLVALQENHASYRWIENVALDDKGDADPQFEGRLLSILEELGVIVDDLEWMQPDISIPHDEEIEDIANEAMFFLSELNSQNTEPQQFYEKDMAKTVSLLSKEDEVEIGKNIERGLEEALIAASGSVSAITEILCVADKILMNELPVETMVNRETIIQSEDDDPADESFHSQEDNEDIDEKPISDLTAHIETIRDLLPHLSEENSHIMLDSLREVRLSWAFWKIFVTDWVNPKRIKLLILLLNLHLLK